MENNNNIQQTSVTLYPDKEERKSIRKYYSRAALLFGLMLITFFGIVPAVFLGISCFSSNSLSISDIQKATQTFFQNPVISALYSLTPGLISSSIVALIGIKVMKIDLKGLYTLKGFNGKDVWVTGIIAIGLSSIASYIAYFIQLAVTNNGGYYYTGDLDLSMYTSDNIVVTILWTIFPCILAPIYEEIAFRGIFLHALKKYNIWLGIIVSSLIFGLLHGNVSQFFFATTLGIIFAVITIKTKSIIPSTILHIVINTSNYIMLYGAVNAPDQYYAVADNNILPTDPFLTVCLVIMSIIRYGCIIAGSILFIVVLVKGLGIRKPTPAGKTRSWPVFFTSVPWYLVFIFVIGLTIRVTFFEL